METHEVPDFLGFHKKNNCAFSLNKMINIYNARIRLVKSNYFYCCRKYPHWDLFSVKKVHCCRKSSFAGFETLKKILKKRFFSWDFNFVELLLN